MCNVFALTVLPHKMCCMPHISRCGQLLGLVFCDAYHDASSQGGGGGGSLLYPSLLQSISLVHWRIAGLTVKHPEFQNCFLEMSVPM